MRAECDVTPWNRAAVTFHPGVCCFVTSCCLEDDVGEKCAFVSVGRESAGDMWSPETFPQD